jgi:carbon storage regulator
MLVVNRRAGQKLYVGENVVITVCATGRGHVRLGITAPPDVRIVREEICEHPPASGEQSLHATLETHRYAVLP